MIAGVDVISQKQLNQRHQLEGDYQSVAGIVRTAQDSQLRQELDVYCQYSYETAHSVRSAMFISKIPTTHRTPSGVQCPQVR
jgi:hypothetical protein